MEHQSKNINNIHFISHRKHFSLIPRQHPAGRCCLFIFLDMDTNSSNNWSSSAWDDSPSGSDLFWVGRWGELVFPPPKWALNDDRRKLKEPTVELLFLLLHTIDMEDRLLSWGEWKKCCTVSWLINYIGELNSTNMNIVRWEIRETLWDKCGLGDGCGVLLQVSSIINRNNNIGHDHNYNHN